MKLKIYKTFEKIEKHWHEDKLLVMPNFSELQKCMSIFRLGIFDDGGIDAHLKDGYISFDLADICERYDIDVKEIFPIEECDN